MRQQRGWVRLALGLLTAVLVLWLSSVHVIAQEGEVDKPLLEPWQHRGIMAAMTDPDPLVWEEALSKLVEFDLTALTDETEIPQDVYQQISAILNNQDYPPEPRIAAARALGAMGEAAADQAPKLFALVANPDEDSFVRFRAADALGAMGEAAADQVPKLFALVANPDENSDIRSAAAEALGAMGEAAADQAPKLGALIANPDEDSSFRSQAAITLGKIDETAAQASQLGAIVADSDEDYNVRSASATALGEMGEGAADQAPKLFNLIANPDEDYNVRSRAAEALGVMGEAAAAQAPRLVGLIANPAEDEDVRLLAAIALHEMGEAAAEQAPMLVELIANPAEVLPVRYQAAIALQAMGEASAVQASQLGVIVADPGENSSVRSALAIALGKMGEAAADQAPMLVELIANPAEDPGVRSHVAEALGAMGEAAANQAPMLVELIANSAEDEDVRSAATNALRVMGEAAAQAHKLVELIIDPGEDFNIRYSAARALRVIDEAVADQIPKLVELVMDATERAPLRFQVAVLLEQMSEAAKPFESQLSELLTQHWDGNVLDTSNAIVRTEEFSIIIANVLSQVGPCTNETRLHLLNAVGLNPYRAELFRFIAYYLSDGDDDAINLIQWLGIRDEEVYLPDITKLTHNEAKHILQVFAGAWPEDNIIPRDVRSDWFDHIARIIESTHWSTSDLPLLRQHYQNLRAIGSTQAALVASEIESLEWWRRILVGRNIWFFHAVFWVALVFVYPTSPQVQAIFFWNPWMRRIFGAGYIGFALTWIPFLRARLFAPFQDSLLANAGLAGFTPAAYFSNSTVQNKATGHQHPLQSAISNIKGQVILEGESGLGKTMFLRHLIQKTLRQQAGRSRFQPLKDVLRPPRTMVFLPADRCAEGVSEAIQVKLHGLAKDPKFLRDLIYSGAIDICIDGLNEVTADTRAKITEFVERYFKGNIIMTTQPLEWRPPATATTFKLKPLEQDKIRDFLVSREPTLPDDAPIQGEAYISACQNALKTALTPNQPEEELTAARRILSNPMDLSIVAQMIANKELPNLFQLQQQQYKLMSIDYLQLHLREFPLSAFSQRVYDMRVHDKTDIPEVEFFEELQCMERHKMVTRRQGIDNEGKSTKEWNFRHDKVMEFFIVQTFLGEDNVRPQMHMNDPRFRGVYFLLAKLMPIEDALVLREELINYAADTRDHTVSDDFVQLLRSRKAS